jgi:hypothetical protein
MILVCDECMVKPSIATARMISRLYKEICNGMELRATSNPA